jgi:ATP-dependent Clp protease ATP-binding subunit ClpB
VIQRNLQDPLAEMILAGEVLDGSEVTASAGPNGLILGDRVMASARGDKPHEARVH